ncbi:MAG TPA: FeoB-associated Cys-rich membrane protein [Clostridium sp.]|nr:FeoB-associated Cys-rich membrane protein [Clostridium sp.]
MSTAIISSAILGFMIVVIVKEFKRVKNGKSICGGNCSSCSGCSSNNKQHKIQIKR